MSVWSRNRLSGALVVPQKWSHGAALHGPNRSHLWSPDRIQVVESSTAGQGLSGKYMGRNDATANSRDGMRQGAWVDGGVKAVHDSHDVGGSLLVTEGREGREGRAGFLQFMRVSEEQR